MEKQLKTKSEKVAYRTGQKDFTNRIPSNYVGSKLDIRAYMLGCHNAFCEKYGLPLGWPGKTKSGDEK